MASKLHRMSFSGIAIIPKWKENKGIFSKTAETTEEVVEEVKPKPKEYKGFKRFWGLSLGILSSFCFSLAILGVKLLSPNYHPFNIAIFRFQGVLIPCLLIVLYEVLIKKNNILGDLWPLWEWEKFKLFLIVVLRGLSGCSSAILFNFAMNYMSMPDATVIVFSTPVFVTFLARIFLKEQCGVLNVLAALVTLAGVMVIVRPPFLTGEAEMDTNLLIGSGLALVSMFGATLVFLSLRALKQINYSVVTLSFGMIGTIISGTASVSTDNFKVPENLYDWLLAGGLACSMFFGQVMGTLATKYEEASVVALTRTFDVLFAFIWQFIFLGISPTIFSLLGSLIVISGIFIIVFQKYLNNLPKDSVVKKCFGFLL